MNDAQPEGKALLSHLTSDEFVEDDENFDISLPEGEESSFPLLECYTEEDADTSAFDPPLPEGECCDDPLLELNGALSEENKRRSQELLSKFDNERNRTQIQLEELLINSRRFAVVAGVLCVDTGPYWKRCEEQNEAIYEIRRVLEQYRTLYQTLPQSVFKNLLSRVKSSPRIPHITRIPSHRGYLNFADALYDLDGGHVLPHNPDLFFFSCIDVSVDDVLRPPMQGEVFEGYINRISDGDSAVRSQICEMIIEVVGSLRLKRFHYLQGPSNTGKSQVGRLLEELVGEGNYACLRDIHDFSDKWTMGYAAGKQLLGCWDIPAGTPPDRAISAIKMLAGIDTMKGEKKAQHVFDISEAEKPHLVVASNYPLKIADVRKESALINRLVVIPFRNPVENEDEMNLNLLDDLLAEKPYILHQAIEAYQRMKKHNFAPTRAELPDGYGVQEGYETQKGRQDCYDVESFAANQLVALTGSKVSTDTLFMGFCNCNPHSNVGKDAFSHYIAGAIQRIYPEAYSDRIGSGKARCRGYVGIALKTE